MSIRLPRIRIHNHLKKNIVDFQNLEFTLSATFYHQFFYILKINNHSMKKDRVPSNTQKNTIKHFLNVQTYVNHTKFEEK